MLVKNNDIVDKIETKMEFKFKDLEIIGKYKIGKIDVVFYRKNDMKRCRSLAWTIVIINDMNEADPS